MQDKDFEFYGEGTDDVDVQDVKGVTDVLSKYSFTTLDYPCVVIKDGFQCPKHKMVVISNMVKVSDSMDKDISLYFMSNGEMFKLGMLSGLQVKAFLDIIGSENVDGFFDDKSYLMGDKVYVLSS